MGGPIIPVHLIDEWKWTEGISDVKPRSERRDSMVSGSSPPVRSTACDRTSLSLSFLFCLADRGSSFDDPL